MIAAVRPTPQEWIAATHSWTSGPILIPLILGGLAIVISLITIAMSRKP